MEICSQADLFILIGSSLAVYPAAGLVNYVPANAPKYIVDPNIPELRGGSQFIKIEAKASVGVPPLVDELLKQI
jgi:NAD-dependent deacetylase